MINLEKRASAHLPAARVWLQRGEDLAKAVGAVVRGIGRGVASGLSALERAQARRMALRQLYALDDRLLQDIGLRREQVPATVDAMFRAKPAAGAAQPALEVDTGGSAEHPVTDASNDGEYKSAA